MNDNPKIKMIEDAKSEGFSIRILNSKDTINLLPENVFIEDKCIKYSINGKEFVLKFSKIGQVQILASSKIANIIIDDSTFFRDMALFYLAPAFLFIVLSTFSSNIHSYFKFSSEDGIEGFGFGIFLASLIAYLSIFISYIKNKNLLNRRAISDSMPLIRELSTTKDEDDYFTKLIQINLKNIEDYYTLVKKQSDKSFSLTAFSGVAGFIIIIAAIIIGIMDYSNLSIAGLTALTGIIINFISAVFFVIYNKNIRQLNVYHDKLVNVQDTMLSLKIVQSISDNNLKDKTMEYLTKALTNKLSITEQNEKTTSHADT